MLTPPPPLPLPAPLLVRPTPPLACLLLALTELVVLPRPALLLWLSLVVALVELAMGRWGLAGGALG